MSIIKETIRYNGSLVGFSGNTNILTGVTMNLKIAFGSHDNFTGFQQEIDGETQFATIESINSAVDEEKRKFMLVPQTLPLLLKFNFYNHSSGIYSASYHNAGFTTEELVSDTLNVRNSFWIFDYYDSFDSNNQKKIFTTYLTKIQNGPFSHTANPEFTIDSAAKQLYYWYIPLSYINTITGSTINGYTKISFFNAKTGNVQLFYNEANESISTGQRMFFETELNVDNMTWIINTSNYPNVIGKELVNSKYVERVNDTYDKFDNQKQVPPSGNTYNYTTNTYFIT